MDCVLIINAGSSSLKFGLYSQDNGQQLIGGAITGIGQDDTQLKVTRDGQPVTSRPLQAEEVTALESIVVSEVRRVVPDAHIVFMGHRVIHGGPHHFAPTQLTSDSIAGLRRIESLAPNHMPAQLNLIEQFMVAVPGAVHYACFDTAFHYDMPTKAQRLAIPRKYTEQGVRKFGFHGLSLESVVDQLREQYPVLPENIIVAHLGSGASVTALKNGKSVDTSMSLTPNSGVPMSTRSGDVDPGILTYVSVSDQLSVEQTTILLARESGLLGISGTTGAMEALLEAQGRDPRAAEAVEVFCYRVSKEIAAMSVALGGVQVLVFAGGMGEVAAEVRQRICAPLYHLGIVLDDTRNKQHEAVISAADAKVDVRIIHTDEDSVMVRHVQQASKLAKMPSASTVNNGDQRL